MANFDPEEIVEFILGRFNEGEKENIIIDELDETFGMDEKDAAHAIDMTQAGFLKAGKIHAGEAFIESRNDKDPYFKMAVKLGLEEFKNRS